MNHHDDQVETNIPAFSGMVLAGLKKKIELDTLVAAFGRSPLVVHELPFIASPRRRGIEANVDVHGNGTGSAVLGR